MEEGIIKVVLKNGMEILSSEGLKKEAVLEIARLTGNPVYEFRQIGTHIETHTAYRGVCGCAPEYGHDWCADCFREWGGPEPVEIFEEIPDFDWVLL